ncbi:MAG: hypothetical protein ACOY90_11885 [Candidatus Zhuqueibacterota bacterium]
MNSNRTEDGRIASVPMAADGRRVKAAHTRSMWTYRVRLNAYKIQVDSVVKIY